MGAGSPPVLLKAWNSIAAVEASSRFVYRTGDKLRVPKIPQPRCLALIRGSWLSSIQQATGVCRLHEYVFRSREAGLSS